VVLPIPPLQQGPNPLAEPCSDPILSGDIARDLVATEEARLCERADKAGLRAERDALRNPAKAKHHGLRGLLPW
jgi:hypothetical protein